MTAASVQRGDPEVLVSEPLRQSEFQAGPSGLAGRGAGRLVLVGPGHARRADVEAFVEARYRAAFGARLHGHYHLIAAGLNEAGDVQAAAGLRFAEDEPLFLEQYLDEPVEQALAAAFGRPVARDGVVEIGAFAATGPAAALALFSHLSGWLGDAGRRFAVATARPELQRLLGRSFPLTSLGAADPARLAAGAADWGRYYDAGPDVLAGAIRRSDALPGLRRSLGERLLARQARRQQDARA